MKTKDDARESEETEDFPAETDYATEPMSEEDFQAWRAELL